MGLVICAVTGRAYDGGLIASDGFLAGFTLLFWRWIEWRGFCWLIDQSGLRVGLVLHIGRCPLALVASAVEFAMPQRFHVFSDCTARFPSVALGFTVCCVANEWCVTPEAFAARVDFFDVAHLR